MKLQSSLVFLGFACFGMANSDRRIELDPVGPGHHQVDLVRFLEERHNLRVESPGGPHRLVWRLKETGASPVIDLSAGGLLSVRVVAGESSDIRLTVYIIDSSVAKPVPLPLHFTLPIRRPDARLVPVGERSRATTGGQAAAMPRLESFAPRPISPKPGASQPQPSQSGSGLTLETPLKAKQTSLKGHIRNPDRVKAIVVKQGGEEIQKDDTQVLNIYTGDFSIGLDTSLTQGALEIVLSGPGRAREMRTYTVKAADPRRDLIVFPLNETSREVSGETDPGAAISIQVKSGDQVVQSARLKADAQGKFASKLEQLQAGQKVIVASTLNKNKSTEEQRVNAITLDWGRVRGYFSAGTVLSQDDANPADDNETGDFSEPTSFVGFNLDWNYYQGGWKTIGDIKVPGRTLNGYLDVRATSIGVNSAAPKQPAPSGATSRRATLETDKKLDMFINSRKVALVQVGFYAPLVTNAWKYNNEPNALFVGPIVKGGIQTILSTEQDDGEPVASDDDVFNFFAFGVRLGHFNLKPYLSDDFSADRGSIQPSTSPELISYLDLTLGRFENFEVLDPNNSQLRERRYRLAIEGRLKIPGTPMQIGLDANIGDGPDDVRFLFGTSFDVGKLFGALSRSGGGN